MARPKYIAELHEANYELRFGSDVEKAGALAKYKEALAAAIRESGLSGPEIEAAVARDFGVWVRQERLPKLRRRES